MKTAFLYTFNHQKKNNPPKWAKLKWKQNPAPPHQKKAKKETKQKKKAYQKKQNRTHKTKPPNPTQTICRMES